MFSDSVDRPRDRPRDRRASEAPWRALTLGIFAALLLAAPLAHAEDEGAGPVQYQVVGEPLDEPAPTDPNATGQPVAPPPTYTPAQPTTPQGYGPPATAEAAAPAPSPTFPTGFSGGVFGSYSPTGRYADLDSSGGYLGDLKQMAGFGGYIAGLGRWVGGGAQVRASWFLDLEPDVSWNIIDVSGMFRFRWRRGIFELYGEVTGGFSIQRIATPGSLLGDETGGGMNFGIAPGFRVFATDGLSFFIEPGGTWRAMFGNYASAIGMRQFIIEFGIAFGA